MSYFKCDKCHDNIANIFLTNLSMVVGCDTRVLVHVPHRTRYVAIRPGLSQVLDHVVAEPLPGASFSLSHPADDTHGLLQPLQRCRGESNNSTNEAAKLRISFCMSVILCHVLLLDYAPNSLKYC